EVGARYCAYKVRIACAGCISGIEDSLMSTVPITGIVNRRHGRGIVVPVTWLANRMAANVADIQKQVRLQCVLCVERPLLIVRAVIAGPVNLWVRYICLQWARPGTEETIVNR